MYVYLPTSVLFYAVTSVTLHPAVQGAHSPPRGVSLRGSATHQGLSPDPRMGPRASGSCPNGAKWWQFNVLPSRTCVWASGSSVCLGLRLHLLWRPVVLVFVCVLLCAFSCAVLLVVFCPVVVRCLLLLV